MNTIVFPPYLQHGDTVAIAATARKISNQELQPFIDILSSEGYKVILADNIFESYHQFAGTDELRINSLQKILDDENIKAVFFARGGYGTVRIIDSLRFENFIKNPKWLVGFSDLTVLHQHVIKNCHVATLHAPMAINFYKEGLALFKNVNLILKGNKNHIVIHHHAYNKNLKNVSGNLIGGNLSVLYSLLGSNSDMNTDNCILFLEDLDEYLYHIDRMMQALKRAEKLKKLKALLIGSFSDMKDNNIPFGFNAYEIILDAVNEYDFPVVFNLPCGHIDNNMPLILGAEINIIIQNNTIVLTQ